MKRFSIVVALFAGTAIALVHADSQPTLARNGMVVSQNDIASRVGVEALEDGGSAVDAAVATAFALAVTHPTAGNIGGGGFMVHRAASGDAIVYDFREAAPAGASSTMWFENDEYSSERHHRSHLSVGVPGTVAGLHLAWQDHGRLPWRRLVEPSIALARDGFTVTHALSASLARVLERMSQYPPSVAHFSKHGVPYAAGETFAQPELADTLERIADEGPAGFYAGKTAKLIADEMRKNGGLITEEDLASYEAKKREPIRGTYRGYETLHTILNVVDFGMNVQEAIDAPRFHHQWLPDRINYERHGLSPDTISLLEARGHTLREVGGQGAAEAILFDVEANLLAGALDRRRADGGAVGTDR